MKKRLTAGFVAAVAAAGLLATTFISPAGASSAQAEGDPGSITDIVAASGSGFDTNGRDLRRAPGRRDRGGPRRDPRHPGLDVTVWAPGPGPSCAPHRDLGFTGANTDEEGAWNFLVAALTDIGGGDPIPTLTTILQYHVTPDARGLAGLAASRFPTLAEKGIRHVPNTLALIDKDPDIANPCLDQGHQHPGEQRRHPHHQPGAAPRQPVVDAQHRPAGTTAGRHGLGPCPAACPGASPGAWYRRGMEKRSGATGGAWGERERLHPRPPFGPN